jgi:hypothetical protein
MKKAAEKKRPSHTLYVYSGGKLLQVIKGKGWNGPAPASSKISRKRRKSA